MPIYEYKCNSCDNLFEILTTSSATGEKVTCDKCAGEDVTKMLSAGSFKLSTGSPTLPACSQSGCGGNSGFS